MSYSEEFGVAWRQFVAAHPVDSVLHAAVVEIVPFGAFCELAPHVHGLLHRTEWSEVEPAVGARLPVRVLAIDQERFRVSLAPA